MVSYYVTSKKRLILCKNEVKITIFAAVCIPKVMDM